MSGFKYESGNQASIPGLDLVDGHIESVSVVNKFGANDDVGTTYEPVCMGGVYRTPQVAGATTLRIKAGGNANDTAAGSGARAVTLMGVDANGSEISETVATAGTAASTATSSSFLRLYRAYVSSSGTYASQSAGSHSASITIENGAGTEDWALIDATDFARGQSQIGAYTVPLGKRAYVTGYSLTVDSAKDTDIIFFQRQSILQTSAPYKAMREVRQWIGLNQSISFTPSIPDGPYPALTDIGFMAKVVAGGASVSVDFDIILIG